MRDFIKDFLRDKTKISPRELNKKIKIVTVKSNPPGTDKEYLSSETYFDLEGNKTEFKAYKGGKIIEWEKFIYEKDELREVLTGKSKWNSGSYSEKDFQFSSKSVKPFIQDEIVETNEKGQKVVSTFWWTGQLKSRKLFNDNNICVEMNEFSQKGALINKKRYESNGQLLEARRFKSDGTRLNYTINSFNEKSQLFRSISVSQTGRLTHDTVIKYYENGLLAETIGHPNDPEKAFADLKGASGGYSNKYFYNEYNLLHSKILYLCGGHIMTYKYSYALW